MLNLEFGKFSILDLFICGKLGIACNKNDFFGEGNLLHSEISVQ